MLSLLPLLAIGTLLLSGLDAFDGITAEELRDHVYYLASDELEGRGTNTPGYRAAAVYAATQFRAAGLEPVAVDEDGEPSFWQTFSVPPNAPFGDQVGAPASGENGWSCNVIGLVPGTDPDLADELITVGAHLDHLGIRGGEVHNGGNDNATGSAALLEIAEALAATPGRRPVLFLLFGAEEIGLRGSKYFLESDLIPAEQLVVNLNLDGVGRFNDQAAEQVKLYALGTDTRCDALRAEAERVNERHGLELVLEGPDAYWRGSDHYVFHQAGIPAVMFTDLGSGVYHTPADDAEPVEYAKLERVARYVGQLALALADRDERICPR